MVFGVCMAAERCGVFLAQPSLVKERAALSLHTSVRNTQCKTTLEKRWQIGGCVE